MTSRFAVCVGLSAVMLTGLGCGKRAETIDPHKLTMFAPLVPPDVSARGPDAARIDLGRMLYHDVRLSKNQKISCNTCHPLDVYGADGQATSLGYRAQHGSRNSPTVYNASMQFVQFWDGRAANVEAQAKGPLLNPVEMAMPSEQAVLAVLKSMPEYVMAFRRAFPGDRNPVTIKHVGEAIGAFERGLVTQSRWDKFLKGDQTALTAAEKRGVSQFIATGCSGCHGGMLVGGTTFQKLGAAKDYPDTSDVGRYSVTRNEIDRMYFKVPPLRNVAKTQPYFHNGKVTTLEEAVSLMAKHQIGRELNRSETGDIVAWLNSLTGDIPAEYVKQPALPRSTARTPKPVG